jgi:hypothetical protein
MVSFNNLHRHLLRTEVSIYYIDILNDCLKEISRRKKNWLQVPDGRLTPGQTGRLTVGRKLTSTSVFENFILEIVKRHRRIKLA